MKNKITVFALSASGELANDIAEKLGTKVEKVKCIILLMEKS